MEDLSYKELERIYTENFSMGHLNRDINSKFALISLICYITEKLKSRSPDVTYYQIIYKISNGLLPDKFIKSLAVICSDFSYGCKEFPTFGIPEKDMTKKIREILSDWTPF